ncbi:hypothetical protein PsYK624_168800 [Phanerochaete sordida]|uniref:Uncharacterized protein n=1 Tax=Phanerochaete sordida TaxID=48140 RepID=A0A9P3LMI0_9APHY|nr:hypothetical protein PsYK624_168800 [Phanerochaete sordida]
MLCAQPLRVSSSEGCVLAASLLEIAAVALARDGHPCLSHAAVVDDSVEMHLWGLLAGAGSFRRR